MRTIIILTCAVALTYLTGCATEQEAWDKTKQLDTKVAYRGHMAHYPNGQFAGEAIERIEQLEYAEIEAQQNIEILAKFLATYSEGDKYKYRHVEKAGNTISALELFLDQYPNGNFASQSREKIEQLEYYKVMILNRPEVCNSFLSKYPTSVYREKIIEKLQTLEEVTEQLWQQVQSEGSIRGYMSFLRSNPSSRFAVEAQKYLDQLELVKWQDATRIDTLIAYSSYLVYFPKGRYLSEAKEAIRKAIHSAALEAADGHSERILDGGLFPVNVLTLEEYKQAFSRTMHVDLDAQVDAQAGKIVSYKRNRSVTYWQNGKPTQILPMATLRSEAMSSSRPGTTVVFYSDPDHRLGLVGPSVSGSIIPKISIGGVGFAIVKSGTENQVYKFNNPLPSDEYR